MKPQGDRQDHEQVAANDQRRTTMLYVLTMLCLRSIIGMALLLMAFFVLAGLICSGLPIGR